MSSARHYAMDVSGSVEFTLDTTKPLHKAEALKSWPEAGTLRLLNQERKPLGPDGRPCGSRNGGRVAGQGEQQS